MDPDEAHYAELTREMLQAGNWLVPLLDGLPYIDKPVLFHWLQGASMTLLGQSEFAARLPSAIAALGLFALTRWVGIALFGAAAGEWGAVMFATIPATFFLASRSERAVMARIAVCTHSPSSPRKEKSRAPYISVSTSSRLSAPTCSRQSMAACTPSR